MSPNLIFDERNGRITIEGWMPFVIRYNGIDYAMTTRQRFPWSPRELVFKEIVTEKNDENHDI